MQMAEFGFWAMLAFWGSAIGGIVFAIGWARSRARTPVARELLLKSLRKRLQKGEISNAEYDRRVSELTRPTPSRAPPRKR